MLMSSLTASTAHHRGTPSHGHLQDRVRKPTSAAFHTPQSSVLPKGPVALWTGRCSRLGLGISTRLSPTPVAASIPSHPIPPAYPSEPGATATAAVLLPAGAGLGSSAGCCCVHFTDISQRLAKD